PDRRPAAPADALSQQRPGEGDDQKRAEGEDGVRAGETDQVEGHDRDADLERQPDAAGDLEKGLAAPQAAREALAPQQDKADRAERPVAPHGDEERRVV